MRALGLMSGTSLDGVDSAVIETDGETITHWGASGFRAYTPQERLILKAALSEGEFLTDRTARPKAVALAEEVVTQAHCEAIVQVCKNNSIALETLDVIGFHGQTILHKPQNRLTVQIGNGAALAKTFGCTVVHDFRADDVEAGGQGAPLVPVFHRALAQSLGLPLPCAFINVGGVANITFIASDGAMLACDTGPGNALIDDLVFARSGQPYDKDGALARAGTVQQSILDEALALPFFAQPLPKSLDRNAFANLNEKVAQLGLEDAAATLTAFTAHSLALCSRMLPVTPKVWVVAGGGAYNATLLHTLRALLPSPVHTAEEHGLRSDSLEAQAFAFLAVRAVQQKPLTFPGTTGIHTPLTGGKITCG